MLELKNISFAVKEPNETQKEILNNINLVIEDNRFVIITGPNGGGKSTLAKIIMGIGNSPPRADFVQRPGYHPYGHHPAGQIGAGLCFSAAGAL